MLDSVTEAIAHFIGQFDVVVEEARLRQQFEEFRFAQAKAHAIPEGDVRPGHVNAPLDLSDFTPDFRVMPAFGNWTAGLSAGPAAHYYPLPPMHLLGFQYHVPSPGVLASYIQTTMHLSLDLPAPEDPGSTVVYVNQHATMSDNDYLGVGGSGLYFHPFSNADAHLASLSYAAEQLSPLSDLPQPDSPASIGTFIGEARSALNDFAAAHSGDHGVTIVSGSTLLGAYVNGQAVDEAPALSDYLPSSPDAQTVAATQPTFVAGQGTVHIESSVHLQTGGNLVVNEAHLSNIGLGSAVMAVGGNDVELNAIIQVNALADHDQVSSYLKDWAHAGDPSQSFNVAQFERIDPSHDAAAQNSHNGVFPSFWSVTQVQGDLVFLNWMKQFAFVNDHDVVVASASGSKTTVGMGDNQSINAASLSELGHYYDLIVVGGDVYSANMITQVNVLVDNDLVGTVSGFQTSGQGSISTGGNLQWNSASILNIGGADRFQSMPDAYKSTLDKMASGHMDVAHGVLGDSAFAGLGAINVLYVSGSIYDLNYVEQHAIVGDSDQVALAMSAVAADPTANWSVVTGSNTVANVASITNLDSMGKTYVGGEHYSDAMLVQSGLVPSASDMQIGGQNPDVIVNEAVAFLADSTADHPGDHNGLSTTPSVSADHAPQVDGVHSLA